MLPQQLLSKSLKSISLQNDKATEQMKHGHYAEAIATLRQAAALMKAIPQHRKILQQEPSCYKKISHLPSISLLSSVQTEGTRTTNTSSPWYLYKEAVRVVGVEPCCEDSLLLYAGQEVTKIVSYAVFFNLGLCHQMVGSNSATNNKKDDNPAGSSSVRKLLNRSIAFYNHAQKVLNKLSPEHLCHMFGGDMMNALAITNNLGHVYYCLNDEATAEVCSQHLWAAMIHLSASLPPQREPAAQAATTSTSTSTTTTGEQDNNNNNNRLCLLRLEDYNNNVHANGFLANVLNRLVGSSQTAAAA